MSGREREQEIDQVGNLVPRDVVEVLALERHSSKSKRRRRSGTIRRAFSWLRKSKRNKNAPVSLHAEDLLSPGTLVPVPKPSANAASKEEVSISVPQIFNENVFIEGNRHKYVEDLHTEALEGLKLKQLEEKSDTDYQDDQSVISGVTSQNEVGSGTERRRSIGSESTATDCMSTVSTQSSRSTRSALSRQGSTFTPLNQGKKERTRGRRKHRRSTVMGIPRHVQKELGLDRAAWTAYQRSQEPVPTEDITGIPALIPSTAVDGPVSASSEQPKAQESLSAARSKDDLALIQSLLPQGISAQRPMSVAVPWATTAESGGVSQNPPSPVMYISPQATYLSKIIPNAVLPPSVDVVEINRNRMRNSVRTVSKCSLASASPAPSRTSSRASSRTSARRPTLSSESSCWSRSDSSETLVSDSSTISSSSTAHAPSSGQESVVEVKVAKTNPRPNGQIKVVEERDQTTGQFTRSLSVMKKAKKPPPPSRSYSLHKDKMKRRSRDLAEAKIDLSGVVPRGGRERATGGYSADESAVEESFSSGAASPPQNHQQAVREGAKSVHSSPLNQHLIENGLNKNLSPSSGYSSHNGTPRTKGGNPSPAGVQMPVKSEGTSVSPNHTKPAVLALKALFDIPKQPKVTAPPPPPPETWAHNQRTFVLLCGPGPANIKFATPPPKRLQSQHGKGEVPSAGIPSSSSVEQQQNTKAVTAEQDSPSMNKRPGPLPPNLNLMQELQKVQQSPSMNRALVTQADVPTRPPQSPPLPPPPPPVDMPLDCSLNTLDVADLPPPPPLLSPVSNAKTCQGIPAGIPPPPQQPPPPPPQHPPPPPPPVATPPPKKDASSPTQPNIPKAPPLPVNFKAQVSLRKVPPPQKKDPPPTNDDSSMVVTQSILQKVRLRSIRSNPKPEQSSTEMTTVEQTDEKPAVSQVAPPKPIRRSLLLAEPPPDVAALIADEPKALPDATEQMSSSTNEASTKNSETTVLNAQLEQPSTSQISSTTSDSQPEAADLKSVPEPTATTPQPETSDLPPQPEKQISDSKPDQTNTQSEQSVSLPDSEPAVSSDTEFKSDSKPEVVSAALISEPEQSTDTPPPEPLAVDPQVESAISKPEQPEQEPSAMAPEPVVPKSEVQEPESHAESKASAVAQTEPTPSVAKAEPVVLKLEPEKTSLAPQPELNVIPYVSASDASKSDPESNLPVDQTGKTISVPDSEPNVSTDGPESQATESKPEALVTSEPEPKPESVAPKSEVLSTTTTEPKTGLETTASTSDPVSTAAVSQSTATTATTTTVSKSLPTISVSTTQAASTALKPQTNIPKSSTSPTLKSPPVSLTPSMRLQEAIRQRAAARSASEGPAKRLSVHSPPGSAGGSPLKSPTSTASFIFSKSNKKVVIETPSSPEVQSSLRQTLQTELAAVSSQASQSDGHKKVPPPVASKPKGKVQSSRNGLPNPSTEEAVTTDVQTAGQGAQSEDTRNTA